MKPSITKTLAISSLMLSLCSCEHFNKLKEVGLEPSFKDDTPEIAKEDFEPMEWPQMEVTSVKRHSNSLWDSGSRHFFKAQRTFHVGDILTVMIRINDKAELENESSRTRNNVENAAAPRALGLGGIAASIISAQADPGRLLDINTSGSATGTGTIEREEIIETEVAAMVTQILPNGNLIIQGDQEIRVNFEIRNVAVKGIVRPSDIDGSNSIDSKQIAHARISYGGRGDITNVQRPRVGSQIVDILSPF